MKRVLNMQFSKEFLKDNTVLKIKYRKLYDSFSRVFITEEQYYKDLEEIREYLGRLNTNFFKRFVYPYSNNGKYGKKKKLQFD